MFSSAKQQLQHLRVIQSLHCFAIHMRDQIEWPQSGLERWTSFIHNHDEMVHGIKVCVTIIHTDRMYCESKSSGSASDYQRWFKIAYQWGQFAARRRVTRTSRARSTTTGANWRLYVVVANVACRCVRHWFFWNGISSRFIKRIERDSCRLDKLPDEIIKDNPRADALFTTERERCFMLVGGESDDEANSKLKNEKALLILSAISNWDCQTHPECSSSTDMENLGSMSLWPVFRLRWICGDTSSLSVWDDSGVLNVLREANDDIWCKSTSFLLSIVDSLLANGWDCCCLRYCWNDLMSSLSGVFKSGNDSVSGVDGILKLVGICRIFCFQFVSIWCEMWIALSVAYIQFS